MAGIIKADALQLGDGVAANNFVIKTNNDGTFTLARGNVGGALTDILDIDADGVVTPVKFSLGQTWQDVLASRAILTPYTNNTGKDIQVSISCIATSGNPTITVDGVIVASISIAARVVVSFWVPDGSIYQVGANTTLFHWAELR